MRIAAVIVSPLFIFITLLAATFFLLFWRMAAEPGYMLKDADYILPVLGVICLLTGLGGTAGLNWWAVRKQRDLLWKMWLANIAGVLVYAPVFLMTLVMCV